MRRAIGKDVQALLEDAQGGLPTVITEAQLARLPEIVQRYLRYTRILGKEAARTVHLTQQCAMRMKSGGRWLPMVAEQYYTTDPPGFHWHGTIRPFPLIALSGTDTFRAGQGRLRIALFNRIPLADDRSLAVAQADALRYLSEIPWFPTAWLSDAIQWEAIDAHAARATLRYRDLTVSATLQFNEADQLTQVRAERYTKDGKRSVLRPWVGWHRRYREMHGVVIPTECEVAWQMESGEFSYFRGEITGIAYNEPPPLPPFGSKPTG